MYRWSFVLVPGTTPAALNAWSVRVTGSKTGYATTTKSSAATSKIGNATWYGKKFGVFASKTFSGTGDDVIAAPAGMGTGVIKAEFTGEGNFIVTSLNSSYGYEDLVFNEINTFTGADVYGDLHWVVGGPVSYLEVEADGPWTMTLSPIDSASQLPASGRGSGVYKYDGGAVRATLSHSGTSNFIVEQFLDDAEGEREWDLIVNEIGATKGAYLLNKGPSIVVIDADGAWTASR